MPRALFLAVALFVALAAPASALPPGFSDSSVWTGLQTPTVVRFAPNGQVYVASKSGLIYRFDSLADPTPDIFADLRPQVQDFWDRGLLGMDIDPRNGGVYVLYSHDTGFGDTCPTGPPGTTPDCVIDSRLSRLDATGRETILLTSFCQQFNSHSAGTLAFGPDGRLYVSHGEGANYLWADFGQIRNPCQDPPNPFGDIGPPDAQGGALRSQSYRRPAGQPLSPDGAILSFDPDNVAFTGRPNIVAYGMRNPFRFTFRPGTREIFVGDVGWRTWEEINRVPADGTVPNFGWPCIEGPGPQPEYQAFNFTTCETLYAEGSAAAPLFTYRHDLPLAGCAGGDSSVSALSFYTASSFPAQYRNALFFGDYARDCIWVMYPGADGLPDPKTIERFDEASSPVYLAQGPDGALYYADLIGGAIRRIAHSAPTARIVADKDAGVPPLTVHFDAGTSSDPEGDALTYAWDLDGDGEYDDSTAQKPARTYTAYGNVIVRLRVTDTTNRTGTATKTITVGRPPDVSIDTPATGATWAVGDRIAFSGSATTHTNTPVTLSWALSLRHCARTDANECHTHPLLTAAGATGSFVAPDHDYPSYLELTATATDGHGLTATRTLRLNPRTTDVKIATVPTGLLLPFESEELHTPFTRTVLARTQIALNAPTPQGPYTWSSWSDGLGRVHTATVPDGGSVTYTATYGLPPDLPPPSPTPTPTATPPATPPASRAPRPVAAWGFDERSGTKVPVGKLQGPLRVAGGRFGNALDFDGRDDWVTVTPPKLSTAMTVEAWVYPTRRGGSVALRETARGAAWALYGDAAGVGARFARGSAPRLRRWTHLAMTYDGTTIRRYVNGALAGTRAAGGRIAGGRYALRFGGNAVWKDWFKGRIDEVRVYDQALTAAQVRADMTTPINTGVKKARAAKRPKGGATVKRYRGGSRPDRR